MRKACAFLLILALLAGCCAVSCGETAAKYSVDALQSFCEAWNGYFYRIGSPLSGSYILNNDETEADAVYVVCTDYFAGGKSKSDYIPSGATLLFTLFLDDQSLAFTVFSAEDLPVLEKAVFYTDNEAISASFLSNGSETASTWTVGLECEDVLALLSADQFSLRLSVGGKTEIVDISDTTDETLYDMVIWLFKAELYSDTTYEKYLNPDYLPEDPVGPEPQELPAETPAPQPSASWSFREDYKAMDQAAKSLFYVETYDENWNVTGSASGFVAFDEHLFVTNQHVIEGASYLKIWDDDDNMYVVSQVAVSDKEHDVAFLLFPAGTDYTSLPLNGEEQLMRGQPIVTIGSPEGYQNSISFGNISAFPKFDGMKYIQFTAPVSHGSSGGCLFDDRGQVIGITTSGDMDGQNLNFAVPAGVVQELYSRWDGRSFEALGSERSWNTVAFTAENPDPPADPPQTADGGATEKDYPLGFDSWYTVTDWQGKTVAGDRVRSVVTGSAADEAGLRAGDIITRADSTDVTAPRVLSEYLQGRIRYDTVALTVFRQGDSLELEYFLSADLRSSAGRNTGETAANESKSVLLILRCIRGELDKADFGFVSRFETIGTASAGTIAGERVTSVEGAAGLETGDVIVRAGDTLLDHPTALSRFLGMTCQGDTVPFLVWRDGRFVPVSYTVLPELP